MRIGLVTDVHNHPAELARALELFRDRRVEQVVAIGDICDAIGRDDGAGKCPGARPNKPLHLTRRAGRFLGVHSSPSPLGR
jgi:hypothetical protein